jgi:S-DNA-T family DNA segregation ATPase FtsK/SpoIIIE
MADRADRVGAVFGLVDVPERQRQDLLRWDCFQGNGNLLIMGAGRSGKSTAAASLLLSLAQRHSPAQVQIVCLDQGGDTLRPFAALPHVAAVAARADTELTRLVWARLLDMLTERETPAGRHRVGASASRIVLIIDGWAGTGDADVGSDGGLDEILRRGPAVGIHTVLTVSAVGALRTRLAAGFGNRIELRLADSFDSAIDRHLAKAVPADLPGRALVPGGHYAQIALPDLRPQQGDPVADVTADPPSAVDHAITTIRRRWTGLSVPSIRVLPPLVHLADLLAPPAPTTGARPRKAAPAGLLLGIADGEHDPVPLDLLGKNPHLLVYGDAGAGKTSVLRSLLVQLSTAPVPIEPNGALFVVDYRRGLAAVPGAHRFASGAAEAGAICRAVVAELTDRLGGEPDRARARIYLLVDDYDLVCAGPGNPLSGLIQYLPHGRDLKFHLVVTRRAGGAGRAQYEPLLQTLGDLGTPVLLLSGSPAEGRLAHGLTPRPLPPGRGVLALRGTAPQVIQIAWVP